LPGNPVSVLLCQLPGDSEVRRGCSRADNSKRNKFIREKERQRERERKREREREKERERERAWERKKAYCTRVQLGCAILFL
jgi:hypothetical protein